MNTIEILSTSELEALSLSTAHNQNLSDAERAAIQRGIQAELATRDSEAREIRAADSRAIANADLL
jgi:hypothetical protein